jgi:hypothetical protein
VDHTHAVVERVSDIKISRGIAEQMNRTIKCSGCRRFTVTGKAMFSGTGHCRDDAAYRVDPSNAVAQAIS